MSFLTTNLADLTFKPTTNPAGYTLIAQDLGSTETRTCAFDSELRFDELLLLDSNYSHLARDISHLDSSSNQVISNLEMVITDLTASKKVQPVFDTIHIVKGNLLDQLAADRNMTSASTSKIDQQSTYINSISNIALSLLMNYANAGVPAQAPYLAVSISLPPEDTVSKARLDTFKSKLAGTYSVQFVRMNIKVEFVIEADSIDVTSEPNAVAMNYLIGKKTDEDDVIGFIDIGGRSAGITFLRGGRLLEDTCITIPIGGAILTDILGKYISEQLNIQRPNQRMLIKALTTGTLRLGGQTVDVADSLAKAKEEFSSTVFNAVLRALDTNNLQAQEVSKFVCSGRTFGSAPNSPSILSNLSAEYTKSTPYTSFELIDTETPILVGLMYRGAYNAQNTSKR